MVTEVAKLDTVETVNDPRPVLDLFGGAERDRTAGLRIANASLSQLSYSPILWLSVL